MTAAARIRRGLALAAGVAAVGVAAGRPSVRELDAALFADINAGHGGLADRICSEVTELGSLYAAGAAAVALVLAGRRDAGLRAGAAAGATWAAGQVLKRIVDRPRPFRVDVEGTRRMIAEPAGTSWPSSHPAVLTAFTRVAARELRLGAPARTALSVLDLSVATSRVYLGVHYPSDVVGGLILGRLVATVWPRRRV